MSAMAVRATNRKKSEGPRGSIPEVFTRWFFTAGFFISTPRDLRRREFGRVAPQLFSDRGRGTLSASSRGASRPM